jgi:hypothetical protein
MNEKGAATKIVSKLLEKKYTNPEAITPLEANAGIKAVDATFPQRTEKNKAIIQELSDLRSQLSDIVAKSDPNLAAAKSASHDYMVGATFRHPFRQTKYGQTSAVPFLSFLMSPTKWGDGRELVAQAAKLPLFSPAVYGTAVAAGSTRAASCGRDAAIADRAASADFKIRGREVWRRGALMFKDLIAKVAGKFLAAKLQLEDDPMDEKRSGSSLRPFGRRSTSSPQLHTRRPKN